MFVKVRSWVCSGKRCDVRVVGRIGVRSDGLGTNVLRFSARLRCADDVRMIEIPDVYAGLVWSTCYTVLYVCSRMEDIL